MIDFEKESKEDKEPEHVVDVYDYFGHIASKDNEINQSALDFEEFRYNVVLLRNKTYRFLGAVISILVLILFMMLFGLGSLTVFWSYILIVQTIVSGYFWYQIVSHEHESLVCCCQKPEAFREMTMARYENYIEDAKINGIEIDTTKPVHPLKQVFEHKLMIHSIDRHLNSPDTS